jgi:hypothetical protein
MEQWIIVDEQNNVVVESESLMEIMMYMDTLDDTGHKYKIDRVTLEAAG